LTDEPDARLRFILNKRDGTRDRAWIAEEHTFDE
jgi:hypothetical protein